MTSLSPKKLTRGGPPPWPGVSNKPSNLRPYLMKVSNDDWQLTSDPCNRIAKMKDGTTHLAYEAESMVDLDTDLVLSATINSANHGDAEPTPMCHRAAKSSHFEGVDFGSYVHLRVSNLEEDNDGKSAQTGDASSTSGTFSTTLVPTADCQDAKDRPRAVARYWRRWQAVANPVIPHTGSNAELDPKPAIVHTGSGDTASRNPAISHTGW